jgi:acyl phosphate:glycerol-3-phosphate acyltransferase
MAELIVKVVCAYVLGTAMGGYIVGRLRGVDLRTQGSGNVGATNALRTQGRHFGLAVLLIDVGKGVLAAGVVPGLPWPLPGALLAGRDALPYACGAAAALGHVYPAWFAFRGGKGAATLVGIFATLLAAALPWILLAFALVLVLTGYVGLATVTAALTALLWAVCFSSAGLFSPAGWFTLSMALLVVFTHRQNLVRVWQGREHRFERAMIVERWLGR